MPKNNTNKYHANRNNSNDEQSQKEANKKVAKMASKAAADYYTGGKGGAIVDKLADTKLGDKALEKMGNSFAKQNPGLAKAAKKLDDIGMLDKADQALSLAMNNKSPKDTNASSSDKQSSSGGKTSSGGILGKRGSNLLDSSEDDNLSNEETEEQDKGSSYDLFNSSVSITKLLLKNKYVLIFCISFGIILSLLLFVCMAMANQNESSNNTCTYTSNPNSATKKKARFTTYTGTSLGGSIGSIDKYIREGTIYYENGYAMWKGGTKSKLNGKVYGEPGTDYMIVAMATKYLFGQNSGNGYAWQEFPNIAYFEYGDTFTIEISFDGGSNYTPYNAIVLDSCGACMEWSLSATGVYSPNSTNQNELNRCKESEGYKIDLFRREQNVKAKADMGFFIEGNSSNICVGEVDLGNLVTGINDTKLLQGKTMSDLYGGTEGVKQLSNQISQNVKQYGEGTGKGVAAAAITLINSLKEKGYRLPYYWAGGHGSIISGAKATWGQKTNASCSNSVSCYHYDSFDCSGFVSWSIHNGGCSNFKGSKTSSGFGSIGKKESVSEVKAGDILVYPGSHVVLVVQNNAGNIILAESSGGTGGVHYTNYKSSNYYQNPNYYFIDMSSFYSSNQCR